MNKRFILIICIFIATGCASTTTDPDTHYKQSLAEIESSYAQGKITREEYDRLRDELDAADGTKPSTWMDIFWGGADE